MLSISSSKTFQKNNFLSSHTCPSHAQRVTYCTHAKVHNIMIYVASYHTECRESTCVRTSAMIWEVRAPRSRLLKVSRMATARKTRIMTQPPTRRSHTLSRQLSGRVEAKHWLNHLQKQHGGEGRGGEREREREIERE